MTVVRSLKSAAIGATAGIVLFFALASSLGVFECGHHNLSVDWAIIIASLAAASLVGGLASVALRAAIWASVPLSLVLAVIVGFPLVVGRVSGINCGD